MPKSKRFLIKKKSLLLAAVGAETLWQPERKQIVSALQHWYQYLVYRSPGRLAKSLKDTISTGTFLKFKLDSDPHKMDTDPKTLVHGLCCTQSRYTDHHVILIITF